MPNIITSRTTAKYLRPPTGPITLNKGCSQAVGLVGWWPLLFGIEDYRDYSGYGLDFTASGTPSSIAFPYGGLGVGTPDTSSNLSVARAAVDALPITMACWAVSNNTSTAARVALSLDNSGTGNNDYSIWFAGSGVPSLVAVRATAASANASSTRPYVANRWHHICGVFASTTSRSVYLDAGSKGTNTTSVTITPNRTNMFSVEATKYLLQAAHACIWNRVFSDAEVYELYNPNTRWDLYYPLNVTYSLGVTTALGWRFNAGWAINANTFIGGPMRC